MLNLFFKGEDNKRAKGLRLITDVEEEFMRIGIPNTNTAKKLIENIEQGKYLDDLNFIDRFGAKLKMSCLSTGCKAGIVVSERTDCLVDLRECGWNARDEIIRNCKYGNILLEDDGVTYTYGGNADNIDVRLDNYHFTNLVSLNYYIKNRCDGYKIEELKFDIGEVRGVEVIHD